MSRTLLHQTANAWIEETDCRLESFVASLQQHTDLADYPHAHDVRAGVLVYRRPRSPERTGAPCRPNSSAR